MKKLSVYLLSAAVLVSCAGEGLPGGGRAEEDLVEKTFTVVMDGGTRATLDGSLRPVWEVGEKLSVYDHVKKKGINFTVKSVDGNIARISGTMSVGGDVPFDAYYPRGRGQWLSGAPKMNLPDPQVIPAGRNICPDVLLATAHIEAPDGVATFRNVTSLLKFQVDRDDITQLKVSLTGSTASSPRTYTVTSETGTLAKGVYYVAVNPGTYSGGVKVSCTGEHLMAYRKSSSNALVAAAGGIKNLGTVTDGKAYHLYKLFGTEKTYSKVRDLLDDTGLLGNVSSYETIINYYLGSLFPESNGPVTTLCYSYSSQDPQGNPVELSARIYVPEKVLSGTKALSGITLACHSAIASKAECPTEKAQAEGALAWRNHAVVMPDYYGFGVSSDRPQAFLDPETAARVSLDAYLAALELLSDRGVADPDNLYTVGYSEGGFHAMACLKYVTEHPEAGISIRKTFTGGSPFDVPLTLESYLDGTYNHYIGLVPLFLVSINESQKLNLPYDRLFKGDLLANWQNWILSKDYKFSEINDLIATDDLSDVLSDEIMARSGANYQAVLAACQRYSLVSGWTPPPGTTTAIHIFHQAEDKIVPYGNFTSMQAFLDQTIPGQYEAVSIEGDDYMSLLPLAQSLINEW